MKLWHATSGLPTARFSTERLIAEQHGDASKRALRQTTYHPDAQFFRRRAGRANSMRLAHTTSRDADYEACPSNAMIATAHLYVVHRLRESPDRDVTRVNFEPQLRLRSRITVV